MGYLYVPANCRKIFYTPVYHRGVREANHKSGYPELEVPCKLIEYGSFVVPLDCCAWTHKKNYVKKNTYIIEFVSGVYIGVIPMPRYEDRVRLQVFSQPGDTRVAQIVDDIKKLCQQLRKQILQSRSRCVDAIGQTLRKNDEVMVLDSQQTVHSAKVVRVNYNTITVQLVDGSHKKFEPCYVIAMRMEDAEYPILKGKGERCLFNGLNGFKIVNVIEEVQIRDKTKILIEYQSGGILCCKVVDYDELFPLSSTLLAIYRLNGD